MLGLFLNPNPKPMSGSGPGLLGLGLFLGLRGGGGFGLPIGLKVVPFGGSYSEFYKVIPKRNYFGAYG